MPLEKQFKLAAAEKPKAILPSHQRRQKFIAAINKQLAGLSNDGTASPLVKSNWVWTSDEGDWFISPRYGKALVKLAPNMNSIKCSDEKDVIQNLQKLKALTVEGKLDSALETAASEIRSRFGK